MPTWQVMSALLDRLYTAGISPADILLVFPWAAIVSIRRRNAAVSLTGQRPSCRGVSTRAVIQANHSWIVLEQAGVYLDLNKPDK